MRWDREHGVREKRKGTHDGARIGAVWTHNFDQEEKIVD
jgi:hypothetical protein